MKDILLKQLQVIKTDPEFKAIQKTIKFGYKKDLEKFLYYFNAWKHTNLNLNTVPNIDKRSFDFQLDHIIPISLGYKYNIDPSVIGNTNNLRIIERKYNTIKSNKVTDEVLNTLVCFGIDLSALTIKDRELYSILPTKTIEELNISTDNKSSLLYYLPSNNLKDS